MINDFLKAVISYLSLSVSYLTKLPNCAIFQIMNIDKWEGRAWKLRKIEKKIISFDMSQNSTVMSSTGISLLGFFFDIKSR